MARKEQNIVAENPIRDPKESELKNAEQNKTEVESMSAEQEKPGVEKSNFQEMKGYRVEAKEPVNKKVGGYLFVDGVAEIPLQDEWSCGWFREHGYTVTEV